MFSYVDVKIREKLKNDRRLVTVDRHGEVVDKTKGMQPFISILGPIPLPIMIRDKKVELSWYPFVHRIELNRVLDTASKVISGEEETFRELVQTNMSVNSILALPNFTKHPCPMVRLHSCCLTGDVFGSMRCECGPQLEAAFAQLYDEGNGAVVYMSGHEGRGIGLWAKAITYLLQDDGQDTYQANVSLGLPEDSRNFTDAAVALRFLLKGKPIRLLSNNPLKREHLENSGQKVDKLISHVVGINQHNIRYMRAKRSKGHALPDDIVDTSGPAK